MKVLWFSNIELTDDLRNSGSWIFALANAFIREGSVKIYVITQGNVKNATRKDYYSIEQWLLPYEKLNSEGLPDSDTINEIKSLCNMITPDIIHVWGLENYWGLLTARGFIKGNILLEIQGLRFAIARHFYSGLSITDIIKCFGYREIFHPSQSLPGIKHEFHRWGRFEKEMITRHNIIGTQSDWVRAIIREVNPAAHLIRSTILIRSEFIDADKWNFKKCCRYRIFTYASNLDSYKGLHILLESVSFLKDSYPLLSLCIIGSKGNTLKQPGFSKWINGEIKRLGLSDRIKWLNPLSATEIVTQLHLANVAVIPSLIESYSVSAEEAMYAGTPSVISFAGAMPELAEHNKTALYFPPGDSIACAAAIERYLTDPAFAEMVSLNSYNIKRMGEKINTCLRQKAIYEKLQTRN